MPLNGLTPISQQKRIPDTNEWIYTNLLKQTWISDAPQWSYTNLLKQTKEGSGYRMPINGLIPIS